MTREQYPGAQPQRGRSRLKASCQPHQVKDTRRAKRTPPRQRGPKGDFHP